MLSYTLPEQQGQIFISSSAHDLVTPVWSIQWSQYSSAFLAIKVKFECCMHVYTFWVEVLLHVGMRGKLGASGDSRI